MNQKFSQQRKPWFQLPDCLMSHSMLVNNIPYHSRTTIYSQNQDPPPSSLRQFHHPPRETPPKAERVARSSSSGRNLFPPSSLLPLPCSLFLFLSLFLCILSHSFLSPLLLLPSRAAAAFGAMDENIKEAKNKKKKKERERERDEPTLGRLEKLN